MGAALLAAAVSAMSVTITEPADGGSYDGDWLTVRALVENGNSLPDSVCLNLNGEPQMPVPRLSTDWPTYMQNYLNHGFSESPAPDDATILWTAPVTGQYHEFPTPTVVDGIVYYPSNVGTDSVYALDAATGEVVWKYLVGQTDDAVTVSGGRAYVASDSLWCLDALTGRRIWASGDAGYGGSTPVVHDGHVFAGERSESLDSSWVCSFDARTGEREWMVFLEGATVSCLALWEGMLFVPTFEGPLYALDTADGGVVWTNRDVEDGYWDSSPVIVDGNIYIGGMDDRLWAFDAMSGDSVWSGRPLSGGVTATPAYHDGRLYAAGQHGPYVAADALTGDVLWTRDYRLHGSSAVADGKVFFGEYSWNDSARVVCLDCLTGDAVWTYMTTTHRFQGSPSVTDGVVYIPAIDGNLYAFGTGLRYTYLDDLFAEVGTNELVVTSFDDGVAVAADTVTFTVTGTGFELNPANRLALRVSPNPLGSSAVISFELESPAMTELTVYDLSGRVVVELERSMLPSGTHSVPWDATDGRGAPLSSGLYVCRLLSGSVAETTGLCILR